MIAGTLGQIRWIAAYQIMCRPVLKTELCSILEVWIADSGS